MKTILLLIYHQKNRSLLTQWLVGKYRVLSPQNEADFAVAGEKLLTQTFDMCFIDFAAISQLRQQMLAKREGELPVFLPFVFLTLRSDIGISTDHLEPLIDDIIHLPVPKIELETKLRVLLRSRSYSLELKAAQEKLKQALSKEKELNQLKSRFVSIVSHEFRNPLNGISGMAQILNTYGDKLPSEKKAEILGRLQRNVTKMTSLLDDVLTISRKDSGQLQFNPAPLNLKVFCHDLISEIQAAFSHKQSIKFSYQVEAETVNLDQKLLHSILTNLLTNASKYSPQNSVIDLEVSSSTSQLVFIVRDHGIGIPESDLPHLFNSFYRASNSEDYQGTGLGLTIVKEYVELHQGAICVTSVLEQGTTFTITIPLNY